MELRSVVIMHFLRSFHVFQALELLSCQKLYSKTQKVKNFYSPMKCFCLLKSWSHIRFDCPSFLCRSTATLILSHNVPFIDQALFSFSKDNEDAPWPYFRHATIRFIQLEVNDFTGVKRHVHVFFANDAERFVVRPNHVADDKPSKVGRIVVLTHNKGRPLPAGKGHSGKFVRNCDRLEVLGYEKGNTYGQEKKEGRQGSHGTWIV